jgi:RHS repeat-associated protein
MDASFNVLTASAYDWETLYGSYRWDSTTGLYHVRYRAYHPALGRWLQWDPVGIAADNLNLFVYVSDAPINFTDPRGEWRFVPGMGSLSGSLGPGDTAIYGEASSEFQMNFDNNTDAFIANANGTCCAEVRFIQIYYMSVHGSVFNDLKNKVWTLDVDDKPPPYFPDGHFGNPSNPMGLPSSMFDAPFFGRLWVYPRPNQISIKFESCAICSKSKLPNSTKGVGDVFACIEWGHSFGIVGTMFNTRIDSWKRHVDRETWSSRDPYIVRNGQKVAVTGDYFFKGIAREPSVQMEKVLTKYFP